GDLDAVVQRVGHDEVVQPVAGEVGGGDACGQPGGGEGGGAVNGAVGSDGVEGDRVDEVVGTGEGGIEAGVSGGQGQSGCGVQQGEIAGGSPAVEDDGRGEGVISAGQSLAEEEVARTVEDDAVGEAIPGKISQVGGVPQADSAALCEGREAAVAV